MTLIKAQSLSEAVEIAEHHKARGQYDWFRGQIQNWCLKPSFLRIPEAEREEILEKMARFEQWVKSTRGLEELAHDTDAALAVAQHYGLPTNFIDFTTEPRIAAFFATDGWHTRDSAEGAILCLQTGDLLDFWRSLPARFRAPECLRLSVSNLWRLQAQHGVFLFCPYLEFESIYDLDRIVFPHSDGSSNIPREMVYPSRKSELEILLDQFFMNERLITGSRNMERFLPQMRVHRFESPGKYGNPELLNQSPLQPLASWSDDELHPWLCPEAERLDSARTDSSWVMPPAGAASPVEFGDASRESIMRLWKATPEARTKSIQFISGENTEVRLHFLERLWDGLRRLPVANREIAAGVGNAMALVAARQRHFEQHSVDWEAEAQTCFGEVIWVEFGADDGSYSRGFVSKAQLLNAVRPDISKYINSDFTAQVLGNMTGLLQAVFDPSRLFEFRQLASLFATQLAPIQVLTRGSAIFYSPARLTRFGLP